MAEEQEEPQEMTRTQFIHHVTEDAKSQRFCFILGAGASKSSGIPIGAELAQRWLKEIKGYSDSSELGQWLEAEEIDENDCASFYPQIFAKRFEIDRQAGNDNLEQVVQEAEPSLGYSFLAEIMARGKHNVVITTNFDSLTEDALFIFTSKKPLVIGHSSLANFINIQLDRPQIIKVHHDLFLSPQNTETETKEMDAELKKGLQEIFRYYTPIVIGYGGNDGGFMDILKESLDGKIFWCYVGDELPKEEIKKLVVAKQGFFISISNFDELMVLIGDKMGLGLPYKRIEPLAKKRAAKYREQFEIVSRESKNMSGKKDAPSQKKLEDIKQWEEIIERGGERLVDL